LSQKILLIEDKDSLREMLKKALEEGGFDVEEARDGIEATQKIRLHKYLLVLSDLKIPHVEGLEILRIAKEADPDIFLIFMTAYGSIETAVEAMKKGAYDFLTKPLDIDHLLLLVKRIERLQRLRYENMILREEFSKKLGFPRIIGEDPLFQELSLTVQKAAPTDATILITGESGTGKELFARAIHSLSTRKEAPFVTVNCAAIPETLLESELFGHEKGSFTGATGRKLGKFELANGGSIFLDEIGEMSPALQAKLLRVLQERELDRVGGTTPVTIDIRIITASNKNLEELVASKQFREDLFFRISVFPIHIPPLRQRKKDIPLLAKHFVDEFSREMKRGKMELTDAATDRLVKYSWPGNIRELKNCLERAVILADGNRIEAHHLPAEISFAEKQPFMQLFQEQPFHRDTLEELALRQALKRHQGDKTRAAAELGISLRTLNYWLQRYRITPKVP
jgi:DNA-binding NtrC family response regulator